MYTQIATVREAGRKVAKPAAGDDDLFRTLVLASKFLLDPKHVALFKHDGSGNFSKGGRAVRGTVVGYSGGSGGSKGSGATKGMVIKTRSAR